MSLAMQRIVLGVSTSKKKADHTFAVYPTQRIDSHVYDRQRGLLKAFPVGALMGRSLQALNVTCTLALRRYIGPGGAAACLAGPSCEFAHTRDDHQWLLRAGTMGK